MFGDLILEKIYGNSKTRRVPVLFVMECIKVFEESIKKVMEENPDAKLSDLFE